MGKLGKYESCCIDRLSALPDSVLSHILSFLPTREAVCTSILSTRWRYLYNSITTLDFYDDDDSSDSFMNFVERVLLFHDMTCIERFSLRFGKRENDDYNYRICGWISFALRRCVQELHLEILPMDDLGFILPASLFTSKTLVKLVLDALSLVLTIPTKVCLSSLKIVNLYNVKFVDGDSIRRLLSGCLVLEELFFCYDGWYEASEINISNPSLKRLVLQFEDNSVGPEFVYKPNIVIDAPSLVDFRFSSIIAGSYLLVNLHSLVNAALECLICFEDFIPEIATNIFEGICNVQSLHVTSDCLELFTLCNKPRPVFRNLVHLKISNSLLWFLKEENGLTEFLASSPNLKTLIFDTGALRGLALNPSKKVPCCLSSRLKVIEIYSFDGQMKLVKYFLDNASVLGKLKIQMDLEETEQFEIAKKLLMLPKKSMKCQVEIV